MSDVASISSSRVRVGEFEFDPRAGELRTGDARVRLQDHPLTVLLFLLERPGELVTREDLYARLWPHGTVVDFEHGLNSALRRLREALGDEAARPRFIETIPRRGYRLMAPVERSAAAEGRAAPVAVVERPAGGSDAERCLPVEDRDLPQAAGRYKLLGKIGAGSTSEVYRALDPRLGRDVAIKLLPAWLARDEAALRRFGCEARLTAALNHPHIVVVYDMVELDGRPGLVLELLAGRTLRQRLADGPVPVAEAIAHGLAILDGLDAAHRARVIHRDLKPDNIFLTRDGGLKLFDFGIARPRDAGDPAETSDESSDAGDPRVPGTAAYMAPEQLRGARGDERADLFAFGCVLVEMVSQRGPFDRPTHEDRLRAVLEEAPAPLQAAGRPVSACLQRFVQRCLAKDPEDRFQSARDAAFALAEVRRRVPPASPSAGPVPQPPRAPRAISRDSR